MNEFFDVVDDTHLTKIETKICRECKMMLPINRFELNQVGKDNRKIYRPTCIQCRSKKVKLDYKRANALGHTKPRINEKFVCPICNDEFIRKFKNDVVLDHSHTDGTVRGYICGNCNTGLGRFKDSVDILKKAISWLEK